MRLLTIRIPAVNKSLSSTYLGANQQYDDFSFYSVAGSVSGKNFTDKLVLGDIEFDDFPMGLASSANWYVGQLGLGYNATGRSSDDYSYEDGYNNFMDRTVASGKIATRAYSIWLDDAQATSGNLLLGAIDQSRYEGTLTRLKATNDYAGRNTFGVSIDNFEGTSDGVNFDLQPIKTNDFPLGLTIGPGEILSYLPETLASKIASMAGAVYNGTGAVRSAYYIACDAASTANAANFAFQLGGPEGPILRFETADLIVTPEVMYPGASASYFGENVCLFGIQDGEYGSSYNLGSSLLRRAYMTFDLDNDEIAVAPVRFPADAANPPTPTIVAFESRFAVVPSATLYCGDDSDYSCRSHESGSPTPSSGFGGGTGSGSGSYRDPEDNKYWQNVAIGVGVSFGVVLLIAGIAFAIIWSRLCRGDRGGAAPAKELVGDEVENHPAMAYTAMGMTMHAPLPGASPPGTLPVIREESGAPQLPEMPPFAGPFTPPEPLATTNRDSEPVSALSVAGGHPVSPEDSPEPAPAVISETTEPPRPPKGKGVDVTDPAPAPAVMWETTEPPRSPKGKAVDLPDSGI
ncbi:aspartic peptidase domain-containing protein [Apodospora peruviana]|uniref:Aspartic peptidase domain-containing protein n=1 Tax=Apodospora peruviana TaxID=516989 RepID=A0AAE0M924_9PEZI|nr:aspartic peptidase domain-containing protein [Apodospora peruviana]